MAISLDARVYVAGHRGLVGSAIWQALKRRGFQFLIGQSRSELDLLDGEAVRRFYRRERPEYVYVAAAKVGGILANASEPGSFLYENLQIQNHLIHGAHQHGVKKLLFLGSSCIYPKFGLQPLREDALLTGPLEPTNQWYAIAKIAGIKLCQGYRRQYGCDFISVMPTNLYGQNDNYDPLTAHVLPALIGRFHHARQTRAPRVECWGTGTPLREFLHADDLAEACLFLMDHYSQEEFINIGSGHEISIRDLVCLVQKVVGYEGAVDWDASKPDGTPRKRLDSTRLFDLGWRPQIDLEAGVRTAYAHYLSTLLATREPDPAV
jgi:GDP-L-fucose synthase